MGVIKVTIIYLSAIFLLLGCSNRDANSILMARVEENGNTWEIFANAEYNTVEVLLNNKIFIQKEVEWVGEVGHILELPEVSSYKDITENNENQLSDITWKASLEESAKKVLHIKNQGFSVVMMAKTEKFIEIHLKNRTGNFKRVIITTENISVADTDVLIFNGVEEFILR